MFPSGFAGKTRLMIYIGTLLLSVLSFYTTFSGMKILLEPKLAFIGSLGLQIALLGIAWSLMRIKEHRFSYTLVFIVSAMFSIFFSYANFDTNLKNKTRAYDARVEYAGIVQPIMKEYTSTAKNASLKARYQFERIQKLLDVEAVQGWSTIVDEGSEDPFIQSVIDGARRTVSSWNDQNKRKYNQSGGKGIVYNYLFSKLAQIKESKVILDKYIKSADSLSLLIYSDKPVNDIYEVINYAWVKFPISDVALINNSETDITTPPAHAEFIEKPQSSQQAFMLVINDLMHLDSLSLFSLLLAFAIDFIVILMAFAGSRTISDAEDVLDKVKADEILKLQDMNYSDDEEYTLALNESISRIQKASEYNLDLYQLLQEYQNRKKKFNFTLKRSPEKSHNENNEKIEEIKKKYKITT